MNFKNFKIFLVFILTILLFLNTIVNTHADESVQSENKKVIYLTFDDGPSGKITADVLDILKEENVPATFFLIGNQIKGQEKLIQRMYDEGHSLGLHSMTHEKGCLYCSNDSFLKEMLEVQDMINSIINIKPDILRFPFGCNNNTYKISQSMVDLLHKNNLSIYDWNVDSGDGANPNSSPETIYKHSISDKNNIFLLMHCGYQSKTSVKALPLIIKHYKEKNYEFRAITKDTPEEFHFLKNSRCK